MRLTRYSDYSLRVLMYLAVRPESLATIEEISAAYDVSRAHLMKVVHELGRAGFVETVRGRGGGLRLVEPQRPGGQAKGVAAIRHLDRQRAADARGSAGDDDGGVIEVCHGSLLVLSCA